MIGLDTNVLVRFLTQDDRIQSAAATRLIENRLSERNRGFISLIVLVELCWVLKRLYGATPGEIVETVADLLMTPQFHLQHRDTVQAAVVSLQTSPRRRADLPDVLIAQIAMHEGCDSTVSFDRAAVRNAGMTLLA